MGACVIKDRNNKGRIRNVERTENPLELGEISIINDKKTARVLNKDSLDCMKIFMDNELPINNSNHILMTQSTKKPERQAIEPPQNSPTKKISLKSMSSFCSSVRKQFQDFQSFTEHQIQQVYQFFKDGLKDNVAHFYLKQKSNQDLDETSETQKQPEIKLDEAVGLSLSKTPAFLRKYLPLQEYSIEVQYL